jgi:hypothetical protein
MFSEMLRYVHWRIFTNVSNDCNDFFFRDIILEMTELNDEGAMVYLNVCNVLPFDNE